VSKTGQANSNEELMKTITYSKKEISLTAQHVYKQLKNYQSSNNKLVGLKKKFSQEEFSSISQVNFDFSSLDSHSKYSNQSKEKDSHNN
jgi:hypothetical protein